MEKTLVILKPSCVLRNLIGEVTSRFERKGLRLIGMKMVQLNDDILNVHYAHLKDKPFFSILKESMQSSPVIVQCWGGEDAVKVVRNMIGITNGRLAAAGTVRGDYAMSSQENIIHASDCSEAAEVELKRFFLEEELFECRLSINYNLYAKDEI